MALLARLVFVEHTLESSNRIFIIMHKPNCRFGYCLGNLHAKETYSESQSPELLSVYMKCSLCTYQCMCLETVLIWGALFSLV